MRRSPSVAATVSSPHVKNVLVRDGVTVYTAREVVDKLEVGSFRSVAQELGIAPSALHRFIGQSGYRLRGRSSRYERTSDT